MPDKIYTKDISEISDTIRSTESFGKTTDNKLARRVIIGNLEEVAEAIILALRKEVKEKLVVTDGSPNLAELQGHPLAETEVQVFYNGQLMDEGAANDYQLSIDRRTITFNYNLINQPPKRPGKILVFYVRSLL